MKRHGLHWQSQHMALVLAAVMLGFAAVSSGACGKAPAGVVGTYKAVGDEDLSNITIVLRDDYTVELICESRTFGTTTTIGTYELDGKQIHFAYDPEDTGGTGDFGHGTIEDGAMDYMDARWQRE